MILQYLSPLLFLLLSNQLAVSDAALTSAQKLEFVNIHNRLREAVYPTAIKMNFLTWNNRLEALAQATANTCVGEHNYGGDYNGLGENIYSGFRTNATEIVLAWHIEKAAYKYATATCDTAGKGVPSCGHYLQVVTDSVLEIGCAHNLCPPDKNLVYCEYSSGSASPPYASSSSPELSCSKCPYYRGLCLNGLCVNSSIVTMTDVQAYDSTATVAKMGCKLNCSNCGVSTTLIGITDCYCNCPTSVSSGAFCDTRIVRSQLTCSQCSLMNTPCMNGGSDLNGTSCNCSCPDNYVGRQCQLYKPQYLNSMRLSIGMQQFCAFTQCLRVPITRTVFKASIWSNLRTAIASAINTFCNSNQTNYIQCCSTGQKPATSMAIVAVSDIGYVDNADLTTDDSGLLYVTVYANITSANNLLCPSSRRKRATSGQPMLPLTALQSVIQLSNSSISDTLSSCCGSSVQSSASYQSYAGTRYGIVDSTGGHASRVGVNNIDVMWLLLVWFSVCFAF